MNELVNMYQYTINNEEIELVQYKSLSERISHKEIIFIEETLNISSKLSTKIFKI